MVRLHHRHRQRGRADFCGDVYAVWYVSCTLSSYVAREKLLFALVSLCQQRSIPGNFERVISKDMRKPSGQEGDRASAKAKSKAQKPQADGEYCEALCAFGSEP